MITKNTGKYQKLESQIVKEILHYLKKHNIFHWKEHGGRFGTAGIPDIICCIEGKFIAFEVKRKGNKPTKLQLAMMDKIRKSGGMAFVVYSLIEAINYLEFYFKLEGCVKIDK